MSRAPNLEGLVRRTCQECGRKATHAFVGRTRDLRCPDCGKKYGRLSIGEDSMPKAAAETAPAWEPLEGPKPQVGGQTTVIGALLAKPDRLQTADHPWKEEKGRCARMCGLPRSAHP